MVIQVYKFINEFIDEEKLLNELQQLEILKQDQQEDVNKLINDINEILKKHSSEIIRYSKIYDLLVNNKTYLELARSMTLEELMLMITEFIYAPTVPSIDQETFDMLVEEAIKNEASKEKCWRLAFNYHDKNMNLERIENYLISTHDARYVGELLCSVGEVLDKENIIQKIIKTNNKEFINNILNLNFIQNIFTEKQFKKLQEYVDKN